MSETKEQKTLGRKLFVCDAPTDLIKQLPEKYWNMTEQELQSQPIGELDALWGYTRMLKEDEKKLPFKLATKGYGYEGCNWSEHFFNYLCHQEVCRVTPTEFEQMCEKHIAPRMKDVTHVYWSKERKTDENLVINWISKHYKDVVIADIKALRIQVKEMGLKYTSLWSLAAKMRADELVNEKMQLTEDVFGEKLVTSFSSDEVVPILSPGKFDGFDSMCLVRFLLQDQELCRKIAYQDINQYYKRPSLYDRMIKNGVSEKYASAIMCYLEKYVMLPRTAQKSYEYAGF